MKKIIFLLVLAHLVMAGVRAQTDTAAKFAANRNYTGAVPHHKQYHAIYQLDNADPAIIRKTIRNINNALSDPRLKGRLQVELIAFGGGTDAYLLKNDYKKDLEDLAQKGVLVAQCANTLRERKIAREDIYDFIAVVPSGNGELILRQSEGWAVVKP